MRTNLVVLSLFLAAISTHGTALLRDSFDYPDGPLQGVSTNRWVGHAGSTNQVKVENRAVKLLASNSQDVHALLAGQPHDRTNTPALYTKFKVRFTTLPSSNGTYFAHFKDGGSGFRARVWALTAGAPNGSLRFGISSSSGSNPAVLPANLNLETDYVIVTRLNLANSVATLWLNPADETDPSVSTGPGSSISVAAFALRQASGSGNLIIDDIIVSTSFADLTTTLQDATPAAPTEPPSDPTASPVASEDSASPSETGSTPVDSNTSPPAESPTSTPATPPTDPPLIRNPAPNPAPDPGTPANRGPVISRSPESVEASSGDLVTFSVQADGPPPLRYQWKQDGKDIPGANAATLQLQNVTSANAGEYRAFVWNNYGTATSAAAHLTVSNPATPMPLQVAIMPLPGMGLALVWIAQPLASYTVRAADSVAGPFEPLVSALSFEQGRGQYIIPDVSALPVRFFLITWP